MQPFFIILVFFPLLGLSGVEGRLLCAHCHCHHGQYGCIFLHLPYGHSSALLLSARAQKKSPKPKGCLVRGLKWLFRKTWLKLALDYPYAVFGIAGALVAAALSMVPSMGKDFLPSFEEETALVALTTAPGTSLAQTAEIAAIADRLLLQIPEVRKVGRRQGRAERGDHVVPVSTVEFDIDFEASDRSRAEILVEIRETMRSIPCSISALSGPLADRVGHMLSGISAKVAIKVFGEDLDTLRTIGTSIQSIAQEIPGLEAARVEQQAPIPQLQIKVDRDRALAYGLTPGKLNEQLSEMIGGVKVEQLFEGPRTIDLMVRSSTSWRESPKELERLYIQTEQGNSIPPANRRERSTCQGTQCHPKRKHPTPLCHQYQPHRA